MRAAAWIIGGTILLGSATISASILDVSRAFHSPGETISYLSVLVGIAMLIKGATTPKEPQK